MEDISSSDEEERKVKEASDDSEDERESEKLTKTLTKTRSRIGRVLVRTTKLDTKIDCILNQNRTPEMLENIKQCTLESKLVRQKLAKVVEQLNELKSQINGLTAICCPNMVVQQQEEHVPNGNAPEPAPAGRVAQAGGVAQASGVAQAGGVNLCKLL